jgi:SAM-dependent methyltransferase
MNENSQALWLKHLGKARAYNDWIMSQLLPYIGKTVLEVGCGNGNFTALIAQTAEYVQAVDIDPALLVEAADRTSRLKNVEVMLAEPTTIDTGRQFDSIVLLDVLEHVEDDLGFLRHLRSQLYEGGAIIVKVPAIPGIYNKMDRAVGHFRRYNRAHLVNVMRSAGYRNVQIWGFNIIGVLGWWVTGSLLRRTVPWRNKINLFNSLVPVFRKLESVMAPPIGLSLFTVGTNGGAPPQKNTIRGPGGLG